MEKPKKELLSEIVDLFEDYEETYVPGEWESFLATNPKKRVLIPQWMKIAAVIFLIASVVPFNLKDLVPERFQDEVVFQQPDLPQNSGSSTDDSVSLKGPSYAGTLTKKTTAAVPGVKESLSLKSIHAQPAVNAAASAGMSPADTAGQQKKKPLPSAINLAGITVPVKNTPAPVKTDTGMQTRNKKISTIDFLTAESKSGNTTAKKKKTGSKWDFGFAVIPTATSTSTYVGGGITTSYRISNKLSLSSGISMLQLAGGKDVSTAPGAVTQSLMSALSTKELVAVNANIKAIDIPLGLVYHVNKHYYTSAGISYFNVLSEKNTNTVVQLQQQTLISANALTGKPAFYKAIVPQEITEPSETGTLNGNSYLGFFNFSVGRKQNIFNKYNILIEPFVKLPVGKLSDENLKLMNSGIKFQVSF